MGGTLPINSRLSLRRKVVLKEHLSRSERRRWRHVGAKANFSAGSWTETARTQNAGILLLTVSCHNAAAQFATCTPWHNVNHDRS
jgi:hypothetical protein